MEAFFEQRLEACARSARIAAPRPATAHLLPLVELLADAAAPAAAAVPRRSTATSIAAFRALEARGRLEIISSAATHGFLPLLARDESIRLQLAVGRARAPPALRPVARGLLAAGVRLSAARAAGHPWPTAPAAPASGAASRSTWPTPASAIFFVDAHLASAGRPLGLSGDPTASDPDGPSAVGRGDRGARAAQRSPYRRTGCRRTARRADVVGLRARPRASMQVWSRLERLPGRRCLSRVPQDPLARRPQALAGHRRRRSTSATRSPTTRRPRATARRGHAAHFARLLDGLAAAERGSAGTASSWRRSTPSCSATGGSRGPTSSGDVYRALRGQPATCAPTTASQHLRTHPSRAAHPPARPARGAPTATSACGSTSRRPGPGSGSGRWRSASGTWRPAALARPATRGRAGAGDARAAAGPVVRLAVHHLDRRRGRLRRAPLPRALRRRRASWSPRWRTARAAALERGRRRAEELSPSATRSSPTCSPRSPRRSRGSRSLSARLDADGTAPLRLRAPPASARRQLRPRLRPARGRRLPPAARRAGRPRVLFPPCCTCRARCSSGWRPTSRPTSTGSAGSRADGRLELLLSGFYEPVLASLPRARPGRADRTGCTRRSARRFGVDARGPLAHRAGVGARARRRPRRCRRRATRWWTTATSSSPASPPSSCTPRSGPRATASGSALFPIDERLRYLIPFRPPEETAEYLRELRGAGHALARAGGRRREVRRLARHEGVGVRARGGFDRFWRDDRRAGRGRRGACSAGSTTRCEAVPSGGLAYLPTASYREMEALVAAARCGAPADAARARPGRGAHRRARRRARARLALAQLPGEVPRVEPDAQEDAGAVALCRAAGRSRPRRAAPSAGRSATTPTGTACSAGSTCRTCATPSGANLARGRGDAAARRRRSPGRCSTSTATATTEIWVHSAAFSALVSSRPRRRRSRSTPSSATASTTPTRSPGGARPTTTARSRAAPRPAGARAPRAARTARRGCGWTRRRPSTTTIAPSSSIGILPGGTTLAQYANGGYWAIHSWARRHCAHHGRAPRTSAWR